MRSGGKKRRYQDPRLGAQNLSLFCEEENDENGCVVCY